MAQSQRLVSLRNCLGLSQREMAEEFGVSAAAIALWENRRRPIPGPVLKLMELYEHDGGAAGVYRGTAEAEVEEHCAGFQNPVWKEKEAEILARLCESVEDVRGSNSIKSRLYTTALSQFLNFFKHAQGVTMKVAHLASFIELGLPGELRKAFADMAEHAEPLPPETIAGVIRKDFGREPEELFLKWDKDPLARTSLGQVHRAQLVDGTEVVVKLQNPDIRKILENQFRKIEGLHRISLFFESGDELLLEDIKRQVLLEIDYRREAYNQRRFQNIFVNDKQVIVPRVHLEYSSDRVLTSDYIAGRSFDDFKRQSSQKERDEAAQTIHRFIAKSLMGPGWFYADPHPRNFKFLDDKVVFLDFGRIVEYDVEFLQLNRIFFKALLNEDYTLAKSLMIKMGSVEDPEKFNFEVFWSFLSLQQVHYMTNRKFKCTPDHMRRLALEARRFGGRKGLKVDKWFFWAFVYQNSVFSICADLQAESNWRSDVFAILDECEAETLVLK